MFSIMFPYLFTFFCNYLFYNLFYYDINTFISNFHKSIRHQFLFDPVALYGHYHLAFYSHQKILQRKGQRLFETFSSTSGFPFQVHSLFSNQLVCFLYRLMTLLSYTQVLFIFLKFQFIFPRNRFCLLRTRLAYKKKTSSRGYKIGNIFWCIRRQIIDACKL